MSEPDAPAGSERLDALRRQVELDLECLAYPAQPWVRPHPAGREVLDCAIIGGGQYGQSLAFGLLREQVRKVVVFDANEPGMAGPWLTFARMSQLRTPKHLTGPDLGIASLTYRAFHEAVHGPESWQQLFRITRPDWQAYLRWHQAVTGIDVRSASTVTRVTPQADGLFSIDVLASGKTSRFLARTVVLATGAEGSGGRFVPQMIREQVSADRWAHTNDAIDFDRLRGKRIGILGGGASSFDNAATALEAGAASVDLCFRRAALPLANPRRWMEFAGFLAHYPELPDLQRWRYMKRLYDLSQPPPAPTFQRATALPGFRLCPGTPWLSLHEHAGAIEVETPSGVREYDFLIAGTGITVDLSLRPELSAITPHVALWGDRFTPPADEAEPRMAAFPYLDRWGALTERTPGTAPWLSRIFTIFRGATLSLGPHSASNSNIRYTAPRIVSGITRQLFLDDADRMYGEFIARDHHELDPSAVAAQAAAAGKSGTRR